MNQSGSKTPLIRLSDGYRGGWLLVLGWVLTLCCCLWSNINSNRNTVGFDVDADGQDEMVLSPTGLGVGTSPNAEIHVQGNVIITDNLHIGSGVSFNSTLSVRGSLAFGSEVITADSTLNSSLTMVNTSSDNLSVSLPLASGVNGQIRMIKKTSPSNRLTIYSGDNIDSGTGIVVLTSGNYNSYKFMSDGSQWFTVSSYPQNISLGSPPFVFDQFEIYSSVCQPQCLKKGSFREMKHRIT